MSDDNGTNDETTNSNPWGDTTRKNEGSGPSAAEAEESDDGNEDGFGAATPRNDSGGDGPGWADSAEQGASDASTTPEPESDRGFGDASQGEPTTQPTESPPRSSEQPDSSFGEETTRESFDQGDTSERKRPEESDPTLEGALGTRNYTQDLLDFDLVLSDEDTVGPTKVNSDGVIMTKSGDYVGLARVHPRSWSIHTEEKKHQIIANYQSAFLSSLDFYTQILCYPTEFDMTEHVDRLEERMNSRAASGRDSPLVHYGRQYYPRWLASHIESQELTQREYYVAVRVDPTELRQFEDTEGLAAKVGERAEAFGTVLEALGSLVSGDEGTSEASAEECIREVDKRLRQVKSALKQLDVEVDLLKDRDQVLSVIYHYYNNTKPKRNDFGTELRTEHDPNLELDFEGTEVDDLLRSSPAAEGGEE